MLHVVSGVREDLQWMTVLVESDTREEAEAEAVRAGLSAIQPEYDVTWLHERHAVRLAQIDSGDDRLWARLQMFMRWGDDAQQTAAMATTLATPDGRRVRDVESLALSLNTIHRGKFSGVSKWAGCEVQGEHRVGSSCAMHIRPGKPMNVSAGIDGTGPFLDTVWVDIDPRRDEESLPDAGDRVTLYSTIRVVPVAGTDGPCHVWAHVGTTWTAERQRITVQLLCYKDPALNKYRAVRNGAARVVVPGVKDRTFTSRERPKWARTDTEDMGSIIKPVYIPMRGARPRPVVVDFSCDDPKFEGLRLSVTPE